MIQLPILYLIVPCFNEQMVLPESSVLFSNKLNSLIDSASISSKSKVLFVDDGSKDDTWKILNDLCSSNSIYCAIQQSRNRGHQNAVLAGLMVAKEYCDITISIDCDGQDDINAIDEMIEHYKSGSEVVYGVRKKRETDTFFKRFTAESYYKLLTLLGGEIVYNHADYRLISSRVLEELKNYREVNLFLRGLIPLVGFKSSSVYYDRFERIAGESHYGLGKMLSLAVDGITSLSVKPIRLITSLGLLVSLISFLGTLYVIIGYFLGNTVSGWASIVCAIIFLGGVQLTSIGVIGEYVGKIYLEVKDRPRFIISDRINIDNDNE